MDLDRYEKLKGKVDQLQREVSRVEGAQQEILKRLKKEFDCNSLDEAKTLRDKLESRSNRARESYEKALDQFEEEWGEVLDGVGTQR
ncbi:hypothetical protein M0R72_14645 [Candidatus Pacearchaeota archaeon]|jgi:ElaB/YqjD/DUF883 family membrane-anchored ribosome-binding protein|nr:hypothetical protein [Candidatus Pacearchaeota archaeon]